MRRALPWIALGLVVVTALVVLVLRSQPSESAAARASRLERRLACPVCTGETVAESNAPEARAMRDDIRDRIAEGETDDAIVAAYVESYGERIDLNPDDGGLALVAWGLPAVALIAGGAGIAFALWRWNRAPHLQTTDDDEVLVARAREEPR
jgi:cytochrome c-type biogenesis protein CcmH